jgi:methyl-accepting chemotaxis protein
LFVEGKKQYKAKQEGGVSQETKKRQKKMNSMENSARDDDARNVFDDMGERMKLITSKVDSKIYFHKDVVLEYMEIKRLISDLAEEKKKVEQERHGGVTLARLEVLAAAATGELGAVRENLADAREKLAQRNQQLDEKEEELATARQQLAQRNHELDEKNKELKALRLKLQEMETRNYQAEQLDGNAADPGPNQVQTTRVKFYKTSLSVSLVH